MRTGLFASLAFLVAIFLPGAARAAAREGVVEAAEGDTSVAGSDAKESADARMAGIVAQYDRRMLDRGGWENPYLAKVSAGNPLLAAAIGAGVTQEQPLEQEGAASGEPDEDGESQTR